ncbi:MAG: winged helix-turn-helix transcriptional regulator [Catenibacterium mitsuokai]|nr:winged helix-turn-helix transcriptional regulator [Catenibacterium mitsuokai]MDD6596602.1 winged helix-turn-helix transcriptional regulator [Catenibacterium mitsuokai]
MVVITLRVSKIKECSCFLLGGFIESWGRGIEKIFEACISDGVPLPEFTINPGDIMVKFIAPEDRIVHRPGKVTDGVFDRVFDEVNTFEKRILDELMIDPGYSYAIIAEHLGISKKTVGEYIKVLKQKGVIERVWNNKTGYWKVQ